MHLPLDHLFVCPHLEMQLDQLLILKAPVYSIKMPPCAEKHFTLSFPLLIQTVPISWLHPATSRDTRVVLLRNITMSRKTGHLLQCLLRPALYICNHSFLLGTFCLLTLGWNIVRVTHLPAACCTNCICLGIVQCPRQNIKRWNRAGNKSSQMLFSCSQSCCPPRTHRSGEPRPYSDSSPC